jgi:Glyoxalase-like domain/Protein of unknown function (DUF1579)
MHTSKLSTFVIDCKTDDLVSATRFWAQALKRDAASPQQGDERYRDLACAPSEPIIMIQKVEHDSRIHLDIESDDIEAEVARLEALGASQVERIRTWVVMQAPTGQRFCVVRQQRPAHVAPPFRATAEHARLMALAGHYQGNTRTFVDPNAAPDLADDTLYIEPALGGRWLRLQWFGTVFGKPRSGEMLLGFHIDAGEYEMTWADTFHTGSAIMWSSGKARQDGVVSVIGSYAAGPERWGWRTEFHLDRDALRLRAFNISPNGHEDRAIETDWTPTYPRGIDDR